MPEALETAIAHAEEAAARAEAATDVIHPESVFNYVNLFVAGVGITLTVVLVLLGAVGVTEINQSRRDREELSDKTREEIDKARTAREDLATKLRDEIIAAQHDRQDTYQEIRREIAEARAEFERRVTLRETELLELKGELSESVIAFKGEVASWRTELDELEKQFSERAEQRFKESENANLALALLGLGEKQYRARDYRGAIDSYQRARELAPKNPVILYRLGYIHVHTDEVEIAEQYLNEALQIDPELAHAQAALGYAHRRIAEKMPEGPAREIKMSEAALELQRALKVAPKLVDEDGESWWGSLGGLYRRRNQIDDAIRAYERAAEVTPFSSYPFSNLALLHMQKENKRDAMMANFRQVELLARDEIRAELDDYWAYADLLTAQLALYKEDSKHRDAVPRSLEAMLEIAPSDSLYCLEVLTDTLRRLTAALGGTDAAPHIGEYIEKIQRQIEEYKREPAG
jgi:tetratricopeptide (TPR) repeat protein